jgi:solute carrier family 9B (sodium/hydrogen exchanger), member 1/2
MLASVALLITTGLILNYIFEKLHLPGLLGMILGGMLLSQFGLISPKFMELAPELRFIALLIILIRAGLGIRVSELKKIGKPALKMSFLPCLVEAVFIAISAHYIFSFGWLESLMFGFILSAVSPAVVVPSMIELKEKGWGQDKEIPTLLLAAASLDNIIAIIIFTSLINYSKTPLNNGIDLVEISKIPISMISGVLIGIVLGYILIKFFRNLKFRETKMILFILAVGIFLHELEKYIPISSFIAIMTLAFIILEKEPLMSHGLSSKFSKVWVVAELLLFSMIGVSIGLDKIASAGFIGLGIIGIGIVGRTIGIWISLLGTDLRKREKLFCIISFIPKATVQAALGAVPLAMGINGGEIILAVAVLSIIITSPIGLILINKYHHKLLYKKRLS